MAKARLLKLELTAGKQAHQVTVERHADRYRVVIDGHEHVVDARHLGGETYSILDGGRSYELWIEPKVDGYRVQLGTSKCWVSVGAPGRRGAQAPRAGPHEESVVSVMPGRVVRLLVTDGQVVERGQGVVVVEAMKMENEIAAGKAGRVSAIAVKPGQAVEAGTVLLVID